MRAEGIHAHGYHAQACQMARHLASHLLSTPPERLLRQGFHGGRGGGAAAAAATGGAAAATAEHRRDLKGEYQLQ